MASSKKKVERVMRTIPETEKCAMIADIFKALGDPGRLRIVKALSMGKLCSGDIAAALNMENSLVSHQLQVLKHQSIVTFKKEGKFMIYSLSNECVKKLLKLVDKHLNNCEQEAKQ